VVKRGEFARASSIARPGAPRDAATWQTTAQSSTAAARQAIHPVGLRGSPVFLLDAAWSLGDAAPHVLVRTEVFL